MDPMNQLHRHVVVAVLAAVVFTGCPRLTTEEQLNAIADELELKPEQLNVTAPPFETNDVRRLRSFCDDNNNNDRAPEPPALPAVDEPLPATCEETSRVADVVAACGPLVEVPPSESLAAMMSACGPGTTCHVVLPAGTFSGDLSLGCLWLEGQGEATVIRGTLSFDRASVLARVRVEANYGAVSTTADLLITEATLMGGYEGVGTAWRQELDLAVCNTRIGAGYVGVHQSWESRQVTVAASAVATCYEGVGISWGSSELVVSQSIVLGAYAAVNIHQSRAVGIIGNVLFGGLDAVGISNPSPGFEQEYGVQVSSVLVTGNDVQGGSLPTSDPDHNIVVR
jgi:hypothetical protein